MLIVLVVLSKMATTFQGCAQGVEKISLRSELEKSLGYSHAVRIGDNLKISGAENIDDKGVIVASGNMEQQVKNCYDDLGKILMHYGFTFDDAVVENVHATNMKDFSNVSAFRNTIYTTRSPNQGQVIEIEIEAYKSRTKMENTMEQTKDYIGMWVTKDGYIRQELLPNNRYDEARGNRKSAYQGSYKVTGNYIYYKDDTGFTADGQFVDENTLHHGGYIFYRELKKETK